MRRAIVADQVKIDKRKLQERVRQQLAQEQATMMKKVKHMQKKKAMDRLLRKLAKKREKQKSQMLGGVAGSLRTRLEKQKILNQMKKDQRAKE